MHRHYKKIIAGLLTAAMIAPTAANLAEPLSASAYELLGETTFNNKMIPWTPVESAPAKQEFDIREGAAHMVIIVPEGADRSAWDLQFRHRNLNFKKGHEYKVSFKAKAKRENMELLSYIRDVSGNNVFFILDGKTDDMHMGPQMGGQWGVSAKLSAEYKEYTGIFIPTQDIEDAEWVFQYANDSNGYGGNAIKGDEIWFDDMSIEDTTDTEYHPPVGNYGYTARGNSGLENNYISVNQLGYYIGRAKTATLGDNKGDVTYGAKYLDLSGSYSYEIVKVSDDTVVYGGKTDTAKKDHDSGDTVCKIDFTEFDQEGEYYIRIKGQDWRSFPFRIGNDIYSECGHDLLTNALNYFYQNRSWCKIESKYITSGDHYELAHNYDRNDANGFIQTEWRKSPYTKVDEAMKNSSSQINTSGGWYTGDDFGKSMTEGGISVWTLQNMYERAAAVQKGIDKFADDSGTVLIPENGNNYPDILDECRYELDFMSKMMVQPNEKTWGEYAGMYYHSLKGVGFEPRPKDYEHEFHSVYSVEPPTFAATLNYAACAAQGARLWAKYDADYAAELLSGAKEAYKAYMKNWYKASFDESSNPVSLYAPCYQMKTQITDGDTEVMDDAYWAACELFISAKEMKDADADMYLKELSAYDSAFRFNTRITGGSNETGNGSFTMFNSGNTASAGSMSLLLHKELLSEEQVKKLNDSLISAADAYINAENEQGYSIPYVYDGAGCSDPDGLETDIILTGFEFGSNERAVNNMIAMAYAYDITNDEKYLNGVINGMDYLFGNNSMAFSFVTGYGNYHAENPSHRFWCNEMDKTLPSAPDGVLVSGPNTGLVDTYLRALGFTYGHSSDPSERFYADSVNSWCTNEASSSCNASLAWIVSFLQDEAAGTIGNTADGDVNSDGKFDISDVVVFQKWLLAVYDVRLENWKAADLCNDGKLDVFDLILMKKELIGKNYVEPDHNASGAPLKIIVDDLKLYRGPDESYGAIMLLPKGEYVPEMGYQDNNDTWVFVEYNGKKGWIRTVEKDGKTPTVFYDKLVEKPVIYLYPEDETDIHVELELTGSELATTYPRYNNGWDVTAYPDGTLLNKSDGTHHRYLFWDSRNCRTRFDLSKGFCVAGSDTESFLKEKLTYMGLTEAEMNEFIVYWLPRMENNAYNLIAFQGDVYTDSAKLHITPSPDSICRVFMVYAPLEKAVDIEPQQLETFERKGFAVVEWGGTELRY